MIKPVEVAFTFMVPIDAEGSDHLRVIIRAVLVHGKLDLTLSHSEGSVEQLPVLILGPLEEAVTCALSLIKPEDLEEYDTEEDDEKEGGE